MSGNVKEKAFIVMLSRGILSKFIAIKSELTIGIEFVF